MLVGGFIAIIALNHISQVNLGLQVRSLPGAAGTRAATCTSGS